MEHCSEQMIEIEDNIDNAIADIHMTIHKEELDPLEKISFIEGFSEFIQNACESLKSQINFKEMVRPKFDKLCESLKKKEEEENKKEEKAAEEKKRRRNTIFFSKKNNRWEEVENPIEQEEKPKPSIDLEAESSEEISFN